PAFGRPTRPTSARSLSSRCTQRSTPLSPGSHLRGARLVAVANRALPRPPRPPGATLKRSPSWRRSASSSPVSTPVTGVPAGTWMSTSSMNPVMARLRPHGTRASGRGGLRRHDADELAHAAAIAILDLAVGHREERVVLAAPDVLAGLDARAALADEDGPAGHG